MNTRLSNHDHTDDATNHKQPCWARVAGAVLREARLSAGVSNRQLAAAVGGDEQIVLSWERGTEPLASVSFTQIETLKDALRAGSGQ